MSKFNGIKCDNCGIEGKIGDTEGNKFLMFTLPMLGNGMIIQYDVCGVDCMKRMIKVWDINDGVMPQIPLECFDKTLKKVVDGDSIWNDSKPFQEEVENNTLKIKKQTEELKEKNKKTKNVSSVNKTINELVKECKEKENK